MKSDFNSLTASNKATIRLLPSFIELFIPFTHWIAPQVDMSGKTEKRETCKLCTSTFAFEEPYCPVCASHGMFVHVTESE
jgi:uncharacterized paraquat-inducible protein A